MNRNLAIISIIMAFYFGFVCGDIKETRNGLSDYNWVADAKADDNLLPVPVVQSSTIVGGGSAYYDLRLDFNRHVYNVLESGKKHVTVRFPKSLAYWPCRHVTCP